MFGELFGLSEDCVSWQSSSELTLFGQGKSRGRGAESTSRPWLPLRWNAHIYSCIVPALLMAILARQQDFWLAMVVGTNCFLPGCQNKVLVEMQFVGNPGMSLSSYDFVGISWSCGLAKAFAQTLGSTLCAFVFKGSRRGLQMTAHMHTALIPENISSGCNQLQDGGELQCNFMPPGVPAAVLLALMLLCFVLATVGWTKVAYSKTLPAPKHVLYLSNATWLSLANSIAEKQKDGTSRPFP